MNGCPFFEKKGNVMKLKKSEKSFLFMILSTSSLFKLLNHDEINLLLNTAEKVAYPKGKIILNQGQYCKGLFIVIKGMVASGTI